MNIASIEFYMKHNALVIAISGCNGNCEGCCNPEVKNFELGEDFRTFYDDITEKIKTFDRMIKNIHIIGGEPLDNDIIMLRELLIFLVQFDKPIWLFTRYGLDDIDENIKYLCDYIKTGEYDNTKLGNVEYYGVTLATTNQKIHKIKTENE